MSRARSGTSGGAQSAIPEPLNGEMRQRLRMLRTAKGMYQHDVTAVAGTTMTGYENRDISTMKLGHLYELSIDFGEDFSEFANFLVGSGEGNGEMNGAEKNMQRMAILMRGLSEEEQQLALDVVTRLADHLVGRRRKRPLAPRRSARAVVSNAIES